MSWIVEQERELWSLAISFEHKQPPGVVVPSVGLITGPLTTRKLNLKTKPLCCLLTTALAAHAHTLEYLHISCRDVTDNHECDDQCYRYEFLPGALPQLEFLALIRLPCSSVAVAQAVRCQQDFRLEIVPRSRDHIQQVLRFLPADLNRPSLITNLAFGGVVNYEALTSTTNLWAHVTTMKPTGLRYYNISEALAMLPLSVEHLSLIVYMGLDHTRVTMNVAAGDPFPNGLMDRFFIG